MNRRQAQQERFFRHLQRASARELDRAMTMAFRNMVSDLLASFMEVSPHKDNPAIHGRSRTLREGGEGGGWLVIRRK